MSYIEEMPLEDKFFHVSITKVSGFGEEIEEGKILPKKFNLLKYAQIGDEIEAVLADGSTSNLVVQNRKWTVREGRGRWDDSQVWLTIYGREI